MREGFAFSSDLDKIQHRFFSPSYVFRTHACGVRVDILEHGALGICKSPVCT